MSKYDKAKVALNQYRPEKTFREIAKLTGISASYLCEIAKGKKGKKGKRCCLLCDNLQGFFCKELRTTSVRPDVQSCHFFRRKP
jgi:hypothetical protein